MAIVLLAANLRTAIGALAPVFDLIGRDVPITALTIGLLGMVPPLMFSITGIVSPRLARVTGLEWALVLACVGMVAGPALRAAAADASMLTIGTVVTLSGAGVGNILVPAAVKKYFPDRIGAMTAAYATIMSIGASLAALVAAPTAAAVGWRGWLLAGALTGAVCAIPWVVLALRHRRDLRSGDVLPAIHAPLPAPIARSAMAWTIAVAHLLPTLCVYALFAWLPTIMHDLIGSTPAEGGGMLAIFAIMGLPAAVLAPVLGARGWTSSIIVGGVAAFALGFLGLLLAPAAAPWLWVALTGLGPFSFPVILALFSLRTRSHQSAAVLSGFVQTIGYAGGALGPLLVGALHELSGGWTVPLVVLLAISLLNLVPAVLLRRPVLLEDELAAVAARRGLSPATPPDARARRRR